MSDLNCKHCNGSGWVAENKPCMKCMGTGCPPEVACVAVATRATDAALVEEGRIAARARKPRRPPYQDQTCLGATLWCEGYDEETTAKIMDGLK